MKKAPIPEQVLNGTTRFELKLEKERSRTREEVDEAHHLVPPRSLFGTHNASNLLFPKKSCLATSKHKKEPEKDHNFTPQKMMCDQTIQSTATSQIQSTATSQQEEEGTSKLISVERR